MKHLIALLTIAVATACIVKGEVTQLTDEQRKILMGSTNFHEVHSTTNLPPEVVALCDAGPNGLADAGKKWEATDYITNDKLPRKRLIWASVNGEFYVVHYERGGYAHSYHVFLAHFKRDDTKATALWRARGGPFKNSKAFLESLNTKSLDDAPNPYH
jgi:hypothetical protein